jgi:hypothetical protein
LDGSTEELIITCETSVGQAVEVRNFGKEDIEACYIIAELSARREQDQCLLSTLTSSVVQGDNHISYNALFNPWGEFFILSSLCHLGSFNSLDFIRRFPDLYEAQSLEKLIPFHHQVTYS